MLRPHAARVVVAALVALGVAAAPAARASSQLPEGIPDPVLRASAVSVSTWGKSGAIIAQDLAVTYAHGPAPSGDRPFLGDRMMLSGYVWLRSKMAGGYASGATPMPRTRIRCSSYASDYILWDILDPLPEDLQVPGTSADRRGRLYVINLGVPPYFHEAYMVGGHHTTDIGASLPGIQLLHVDAAKGWSGSPVVNAAGKVVGLFAAFLLTRDPRAGAITPAEDWRCR
jgi:hypothetical protein